MKVNCRYLGELLTVALITLGASIARADDLVPPPWDRGADRTTTQEWTFDNPGDIFGHPIGPFGNPYGLPLVKNPEDAVWLPDDLGFNPGSTSPRLGIICLGPDHTLMFLIPNQESPENHKDIWVQLTWWAGTGDDVVISPIASDPNTGELVGTIDLGNGWHHTTAHYVLEHQPPYEEFWIINHTPDNVYFDQLVIDTHCVPEPATMTALGLGALGLAVRRRRAKA